MRGPLAAIIILVGSGCATTPAPKIPFAEAMRAADEPPVEEPRVAPSLTAAVATFCTAVQAQRAAVGETGGRMPEAHQAAWRSLLQEVNRFLSRPLAQSAALDAVRARLRLETELEADARLYGDVPAQLAEDVQRTLRRLSQKLTALSERHQRRADPSHFAWPVQPVVVTSPYGHRVHPLSGDYRFHAGIDLEAEEEQPIYAAEAGLVVFAGWNGAHGKQVEVQHDAHVFTRYSHLETLYAEPGRPVKKGQLLGLAGQTGQVTGPHLHFELRRDGDALDPEVLLPPPPRAPRLVWR